MSKIGRQQLSPSIVNELKDSIMEELGTVVGGNAVVTMGEFEPEGTPTGSLWFQSGLGNFDPSAPMNSVLLVKNSIISDDEPENFDRKTDIWFDIEG